MMISQHERLVRETGRRLNPSLPVEYEVLPKGSTIPVKAWTDLRTAVVQMDESWKPQGDFLARKGEKTGIEAVCRDIPAHEVAGHNNSEFTQGCPGNVDFHAVMKHQVAKALKEAGKSGLDYLTNAVQDIHANTIVRGISGHSNAGLTLFYEKNLINPSRFFEAFAKLNLVAWGNAADITHLRPYFKNVAEVNAAWKNAAKELDLRLGDLGHNRKILTDKSKWENQAYIIAKHLAPLLDDHTCENTCSHGNTPGECNNPFDEELREPVVQRRVAKEFYDGKRGIPAFMKKTDALLRLYEALGEMPVSARAETQSLGVPIIPYQWKPTDDLTKASLTKFGIDASGGLVLQEPSARLDIPFHYTKQQVDHPDLVVAVLDRSPSMLEALESGNDTKYVPWGDKSKWHYMLWGWFAVTNDLVKTGKIAYVRNNALLFATQTKESGVHRGTQLDALRRWILEHPPSQTEGTSLDMAVLRNNCAGTPKVFITMSDGEVSNWKDVKAEYLLLTSPHLYAHVQIGLASEMSKDLRAAGRNVYSVQKGKDMVALMRGIVAEAYQ
ncbi:hypothetical protein J4211_01440 [Candidatus Woesearchaeota archaeon]|nr:hypothetical protein [uncultured archaeon]AQS33870.1 hypothetical protein [uncultured archaeon]MBS3124900.1 hypothetical protein [Candidatus Woesearchaeota archaeon]